MNYIFLNYLELKTFNKQDALDYCLLNNININNITSLRLDNNNLTDISGVKLFKNLEILLLHNNIIKDISVLKDLNNIEYLDIGNNDITDISVIQYLNNLEILHIEYLRLESDQIQYIQSLKNLEELGCGNGFKNMSVLNKLNKNINIIKI